MRLSPQRDLIPPDIAANVIALKPHTVNQCDLFMRDISKAIY